MSAADAYVLDGVRTPTGRHGGALADVRPDDLAALVVGELLRRHPGLDPAAVDDVVMGDANGAGEDNRNVARMATLLAGLPVAVPATTVNRLCGSGMQAVIDASRAVAAGDASLVVAGGVESMTRAPWVLEVPGRAWPTAPPRTWPTALGWRMTNPALPPQWTVALGEGAEILAERGGISREDQDRFALASHRRAAAAWAAGDLAGEVVAVPGHPLGRDEAIRTDTDLDALGRLRPAFRATGTVTAGNSSPLADGAAAVLVGTEAAATAAGARPLARIAGRAVRGVEPHLYGLGPVAVADAALSRAGIGWGDLAAVELNEAFAAQSLACLAAWPQLDPELVNQGGGAIAIGHPLGSSGARLVATLAHRLHRTGGRWGLATMCIGVGQGIAVVLEGT